MPIIYQIKVQGKLKDCWSEWFNGMTITFEIVEDGSPVTTFIGPVVDQTALHGLLSKIRDLGLPLMSLSRVERDLEPSTKAGDSIEGQDEEPGDTNLANDSRSQC